MKKLIYWISLIFFSCTQTEDSPNKYIPFSNTFVEITLPVNLQDTLFAEVRASIIIPYSSSVSNTEVMYNAGKYLLNLKIDRPVYGELKLNEDSFRIIILPNDTTHIELTKSPALTLHFTDKFRVINDYYSEKNKILGYSEIRIPINNHFTSKTTYSGLKHSVDSIAETALIFLKDFDTTLPKWFVDYEESEIIYACNSFKTSLPSLNKRFKVFKDTLPADYYNYLSNLIINNEEAILSSAYQRFLDSYFLIDVPDELDQLAGAERQKMIRKFIIEKSGNELSGKPKDVYHTSHFAHLLKFYSDSLEIDSLAKAFEVADYQHLFSLAGTASKNSYSKVNLSPGDTIPNFYVSNVKDELISFSKFKDKIVYINFWATWCGPCIQNIPMLNEMISSYQPDSRIVFLNVCLDSDRERWTTLLNQHNLKGINLYAEGNWNQKLKSNFNINGIPHYVIVGKDNVLIENFANKAPAVSTKLTSILE